MNEKKDVVRDVGVASEDEDGIVHWIPFGDAPEHTMQEVFNDKPWFMTSCEPGRPEHYRTTLVRNVSLDERDVNCFNCLAGLL